MITKEQIQAFNPRTLAAWLVRNHMYSGSTLRVMTIACRNGGYVCAGNSVHKGSVERVAASSIRALVRRGFLVNVLSPDGGYAARFSPRVLEEIEQQLAAYPEHTP